MRIVHVTLRFDAPGGVETNVHEVTKGLKAAGEDVRVFASDLYSEVGWERRSSWSPVVDGVPVRRFPVYRRLIPGLTLPLWTGLMPALAEGGIDLIHAHSHRYGHVLEAGLVTRRRGIPLVVSTHYHPADRREPAWKRGMLRVQDHVFGMTAYREASALVVETELEAARVREFSDATKIHVIPPGVDLIEWQSDSDPPPPPGLPARFLLYAGRIASNKGLPFLLRSYARVPVAERVPLILMGRDWGERTNLEAQARSLGVGSEVRFLGHLEDRGQYRSVVRAASALVLPSEWEAFGLVLLEAMAADRPVVATSVGGVPEVLEGGRSGLLVTYGEEAELAGAIRTVLTDEDRRAALVAEGHRRVRELTWARCVDRHRALYRTIAG